MSKDHDRLRSLRTYVAHPSTVGCIQLTCARQTRSETRGPHTHAVSLLACLVDGGTVRTPSVHAVSMLACLVDGGTDQRSVIVYQWFTYVNSKIQNTMGILVL